MNENSLKKAFIGLAELAFLFFSRVKIFQLSTYVST